MKKLTAILISCFALTGCGGGIFHGQDQASCDGYGFKRGTEAHANCMMQRDGDRRRVAAANMAQPKPMTCIRNGSVTTCR